MASTHRETVEYPQVSEALNIGQTDGDIKMFMSKYSRLSLCRSQRDPLKHFEISLLRHIRCADSMKMSIEQPNFTNEHVI